MSRALDIAHEWIRTNHHGIGQEVAEYGAAETARDSMRSAREQISDGDTRWRGMTAKALAQALRQEFPARRKNPTKAQKREKAKRTAAKSRIAKALQNFVRKANPAAKGMVKATKVKGGWNVRVVDVRRSK